MKNSISIKKTCCFTYAVNAILIATGYSTSAQAQMVDYGSLQALFGEPVTTSATGTPQRASDVVANMTIITADEIRQSGSRSIPEILARVPGLDILQTGYAGYDVGVRGYQQPFQPRLLVLVDGRQVFVDDYSRTDWNNIPVNVDDIRQIEVVEGPSSALFGSNAAGGVVNIVTYSPVFDHNNVVSAYAGSQRTFGADATVTENGDWGGTKITAGGYNADEFNSPINSTVDDNSLQPYHRYVANNSVFHVTPKFQIDTEFTYSDSKENFALGNGTEVGNQNESYSLRGGFQWQTDYGLIVNDNYFNRTYDVLFFNANLGGQSPLTTDLAVSKIEDQFKIGSDNTFRIGFEYRNKTFENGNVGDIVPESPALEEDNYAENATWLWQINDQLSWTNAARFDHMDMSETGTLAAGSYYNYADYGHDINTLSVNSGFDYKATSMDTFRLSYGRGVQQPSMIDSSLSLTSLPGIEITGNPELKPTIVQNYELDYDRKITPIYSTAKFAVFYQDNQDLTAFYIHPGFITFNGNPNTLLYNASNVGGSQGWGGEVELKGGRDGFRWDASYSLSRVDDDAQTGPLLGYDGSAPEHQFKLFGGYTWKQWEFDANGQYVTSTNMLRDTGVTENLVEESGYYSFGGRIGYNINDHFTLALSGTNLNTQYIQESPYPAVERTALVTLTGRF